jgi:hypothetical protein
LSPPSPLPSFPPPVASSSQVVTNYYWSLSSALRNFQSSKLLMVRMITIVLDIGLHLGPWAYVGSFQMLWMGCEVMRGEVLTAVGHCLSAREWFCWLSPLPPGS